MLLLLRQHYQRELLMIKQYLLNANNKESFLLWNDLRACHHSTHALFRFADRNSIRTTLTFIKLSWFNSRCFRLTFLFDKVMEKIVPLKSTELERDEMKNIFVAIFHNVWRNLCTFVVSLAFCFPFSILVSRCVSQCVQHWFVIKRIHLSR